MNKSTVLALVVAAFLLGLWVGSMRSSAEAQPPAAAAKPPMFQEVVVPDKNGEQGAVYMIYHGPGQICRPSEWIVPLHSKTEKPAGEKPVGEKPAAEKPKVEMPIAPAPR
jgi:hypothetical protein